ncbi:winged helix-turn-helix domain-containing protein [Kitasatospora sp. NPDC101447]|uniref:winged helix-turn-helix domain-containing protein n=1 Tax=Kitasatospora sp. NPDC101447 TaxID=3364102 RepID=UPI00380D1B8E
MTEEDLATAGALPEHAVRTALLDLLAEHGTITSTEAAARLGVSSGLCSFHLRQLGRHGLIEEAPPVDGRARPWRLPRAQAPRNPQEPDGRPGGEPGGRPGNGVGPGVGDEFTPGAGEEFGDGFGDGFGALARGLEDESYQRWLAHRAEAPADWQHDEAFSAVVYLTPDELSAVGEAVRQVLARYRGREADPATRPAGARPVAAVTRLFPLLDALPAAPATALPSPSPAPNPAANPDPSPAPNPAPNPDPNPGELPEER